MLRFVAKHMITVESKRFFAVNPQVFDRSTKLHQKRLAAMNADRNTYNYLNDKCADCLFDRILDIVKPLKKILNFNCDQGQILKYLTSKKIDSLILADSIQENLDSIQISDDLEFTVKKMLINEENLQEYPAISEIFRIKKLEEKSLDLIISNLTLHWTNDLSGALSKCCKALNEDGVFLASIFGCDTLFELRCSLQLAEMERLSGISCHISPFTKVQDIAGLLRQSGFVLQTIDTFDLIVNYPTMWELMFDLQAMGENNAAIHRCVHLHRDVQFAAAAIYEQMYGNQDRNSIPATFQIINMIGWKPGKNQPQPLEPGSAKFSLKDLNKVFESLPPSSKT